MRCRNVGNVCDRSVHFFKSYKANESQEEAVPNKMFVFVTNDATNDDVI